MTLRKLTKLAEIIISVLILLSVALMCAEECARLLSLRGLPILVLSILGFAFDLVFSLEFIIRSLGRRNPSGFFDYLVNGMGWADFLSSVPLLCFVSGPMFFGLLDTGVFSYASRGALGIFKIMKMVRVSRILRLLRSLKLLQSLKNLDSPSTQNHMVRILSLCVCSLCGLLIAKASLASFVTLPGTSSGPSSGQIALVKIVKNSSPKGLDGELLSALASDPETLQLSIGSQLIYERPDYLDSPIIAVYREGNAVLLYAPWEAERSDALFNLFTICAVILLFLVIVVFYAPYFTRCVSDPVLVVRRGLEESDYDLEARLPFVAEDDDVYRLATAYNEVFLPEKAKNPEYSGRQSLDVQATLLDSIKDEVL